MGKKETSIENYRRRKVVFVQHFGQSRIYAFNIDFDVKCGDYLLAKTQKGDSVVRAISDSVNIETDKITEIIQQYAVISKIKHKLELRVDLGFNDNKLP